MTNPFNGGTASSGGGRGGSRRHGGGRIMTTTKMTKMMSFFLMMMAVMLMLIGTAEVEAKNMNDGDPYYIANSDTTMVYPDDMEYFDVYSNPIKTLYSQVHWIDHRNIDIPKKIVERFANKDNNNSNVMAIVGYEVDQVRVDPTTGQEIPVPITWSYNHHYCVWVYDSTKNKLVTKDVTASSSSPELKAMGHHGSNHVLVVEGINDDENSDEENSDDDDIPTKHFISEGNGGEMRKSYHGYPKGYAQLIRSPNKFTITPMQIDTWDRDLMKNGTFVPGGPIPNSNHRIDPTIAGYNPLLECPCTDRLPKELHMTYKIDDDNNCEGIIQTSKECFDAVPKLIPSIHVTERVLNHISTSYPSGCSASLTQDGTLDVVWNNAKEHHVTTEKVLKDHHHTNMMVGVAKGVVNMTIALPTTTRTKKEKDEKEEEEDVVEITLIGPADKWFGVGFGTDSMCLHMEADECPTGGPYAIIVKNDDTDTDDVVVVEERKLAFHGEGEVLPSTIKVLGNHVDLTTNTRTVKLSRPLKIIDDDDENEDEKYYEFDPNNLKGHELPVIMATGCSMEFAQHCGHGINKVTFIALDTATKVCQAGIEGTIGGQGFNNHRCSDTNGDLIDQKNPTCRVETYQGGLHCCRHDHYLLDKDQDIPWQDQPLEFRLKFRIYFEEYTPASTEVNVAETKEEGRGAVVSTTRTKPSHRNLARVYWMTEQHAGEYDIPQCPKGTPPSQCVHVITSQFKVRQVIPQRGYDGVQLIYAGPHCHAGTCLSMELYNADTGELLCHVEPIRGTGDVDNNRYDEHGFLAIPPCLWSDADIDDGLPVPQTLDLDTTLLSVKRANSTFPHTGEMASWQMRGVLIPKQKQETKEKDQMDSSSSSSSSSSSYLRPSSLNKDARDEI